MRHKKLKLSAVLLFGFGLTGLQAQEVIPATGGNASGSGGSASYSVGQVVYTTNSGTNGSAIQGIQQPYEILVVTGMEEAEGITLTAYPNPTTDDLTLKTEDNVKPQYIASLYDMKGKLLRNKKIESSQTNIDMSNLGPATYFVKVIVKKQDIASQEVKAFKIIKF